MTDLATTTWETARRAWPALDVSLASWRAFLGEDRRDLGSLHVADVYLACACAEGNVQALEAFEARYVAEVPLFLAGIESDEAVLDEVRQLVRQRLFVGEEKKITEYSGRGSLGSWMRVVTLRVASNHRRGTKRHHELTEDVLPPHDPELKILQERYQGSFDKALRAAFDSLTPRERLLFRMHFVDGLNIDRMGLVFSVHRATVARWMASAREKVLERAMALLGDELRLDPAELASLLRVVRSGLDVSLHGLLSER